MSRPSAPRTASAAPSDDTKTSGCGVRIARTQAITISTAPAQRRFQQADHDKPRGDEQQRPGAKRSHPADRARQPRHEQHHLDHPVDALTHQPPEHAVEAERDGQ
jgi:hypothetical protein